MMLHIGIDFDNTLISYDALFFECALAKKMIPCDFRADRHVLRSTIRQLRDGERLWQQLQAEVYGIRIDRAPMMEGASAFLSACRKKKIKVLP